MFTHTSTRMYAIATTLMLLLLTLSYATGDWSPSVLKSTIPCEDLVDFPCDGGCLASDCKAGGRHCWNDFFIQCKCIPSVALKELSGSTDADALDGMTLCIWSLVVVGGGEPVCCNSYRRSLAVTDNDVASLLDIQLGGADSKRTDTRVNTDDSEITDIDINKSRMTNTRNEHASNKVEDNERDVYNIDKSSAITDGHLDDHKKGELTKRRLCQRGRQKDASLIMEAICKLLFDITIDDIYNN